MDVLVLMQVTSCRIMQSSWILCPTHSCGILLVNACWWPSFFWGGGVFVCIVQEPVLPGSFLRARAIALMPMIDQVILPSLLSSSCTFCISCSMHHLHIQNPFEPVSHETSILKGCEIWAMWEPNQKRGSVSQKWSMRLHHTRINKLCFIVMGFFFMSTVHPSSSVTDLFCPLSFLDRGGGGVGGVSFELQCSSSLYTARVMMIQYAVLNIICSQCFPWCRVRKMTRL